LFDHIVPIGVQVKTVDHENNKKLKLWRIVKFLKSVDFQKYNIDVKNNSKAYHEKDMNHDRMPIQMANNFQYIPVMKSIESDWPKKKPLAYSVLHLKKD
jgi:hypothetical protein